MDGTGVFAFSSLPPLSLYIHIPWCIRKCPYCDFNSHETGRGIPDVAAYTDALLTDLEQELSSVWGRTIESIFIGGGTPSLFSPEAIDNLLSQMRARLPLRPGLEITMEANPGTFERGRFTAYREAGVTRLSIGVQSFNARHLERIGRIHGPKEALMACEEAAEAGFSGWNIDLMFGLPSQSLETAAADLEKAIALGPSHISYYQLTVEPNTAFHHEQPVLPDDDAVWRIQEQGQTLLREAGYEQYEVSAYARPDQRCRHNLNYWGFGDYIGIGAGAHGKITLASEQRIRRYSKQRHPETYMRTAGTNECLVNPNYPSAADTIFEFMLNAFRLNEGFTWERFRTRTGLFTAHTVEDTLREAQMRGLVDLEGEAVRASALGRNHLNELLLLFLPDADPDT
ncbi:MAG: oxygen-independent coproporphyrinogen III oxidase-like protein [Gammaproteobacteria bacterium]|nr:oxygen-independent coproporphyrinogen III oxidase-like protein [Gammaproteobacteria bacterium]